MLHWWEGCSIYVQNISMYYVFTIVVTVAALLVSHYFIKCARKEIDIRNRRLKESTVDDLSQTTDETIPCYKPAQMIAREMNARMTEEQLQEEKNAEKQQLEAIFKLLREERDKFHVSKMEELEEQLKLYR